MTKKTLLAAGAGLLVAGLAFAYPMFGGPDYTTMPPNAGHVHSSIGSAKIHLSKAVELAEKETGGRAVEASSSHGVAPTGAPSATYTVIVYGPDWSKSVTINANTGEMVEVAERTRFPGAAVAEAWSDDGMVTDSGLHYYEIVAGDGPMPAGPGTTVKVHYTGYLLDGTKFDSSLDRGTPTEFRLDQVIPGWTEGVGSMKVGGTRKLVIPYDLAYGPSGRGPIPPAATLVFDVQLLDIVSE